MTEQAKAARAAYARQYRATHKEQIAASKRKYYETHKEQVREAARKYYADHKEEAKLRNSEYWNRKAMSAKETPETPIVPETMRKRGFDEVEPAANPARGANNFETPETPSAEIRLQIKKIKLASRIRESN